MATRTPDATEAAGDRAPALAPLGQDGLLIRFTGLAPDATTGAVQMLVRDIEVAGFEGVTEVAGSLGSVLVRFDPGRMARANLAQALPPLLAARDWARLPAPAPTRRWLIPAAFGGDLGPDLAEAASMAGLSPQAAIDQIAATDLRVLAIGFAPGQPYLGRLPANWDLPRRAALTPQVPQGAIAAAVRQLVLFTNASKTGWHWLGQAAFRPFEPARAEPLPLAQGDALRFVPVALGEMQALMADNADGLGGARCEKLS